MMHHEPSAVSGGERRFNPAFVAEFVKMFGDTPDSDVELACIAEHFWEMGYEEATPAPAREADTERE